MTDTEKMIVSMMADGYQNKEICAHSKIQVGTLEDMRQKMYKKFGVKNGPHLVAYALRNQLIK